MILFLLENKRELDVLFKIIVNFISDGRSLSIELNLRKCVQKLAFQGGWGAVGLAALSFVV